MGRRFEHGVTDSTSERAFAAIAQGDAQDGDWHVAEEQTQGRGRRGRLWHSPASAGLYLSLIHRSPVPLPPAGPSMAAGLALLDTVSTLGLVGARLKWPNDLMVGAAKLAGVLVETRGWDQNEPIYVIGVGLNVRCQDFPEELLAERSVTSLEEQGISISPADVEEPLLASLHRRLAQVTRTAGEALCSDYLAALGLDGGPVRAATARNEVVGEVLGLQLQEGLRLRGPDGAVASLPLEFLERLESAS